MNKYIKLGLFATLVFLPSCSKKDSAPITNNDKLIIYQQSNFPYFAAQSSYNKVNYQWVIDSYQDYRGYIAQGAMGVVKWDELTLCTYFSNSYAVWAQKQFQEYAWYHQVNNKQIAVGVTWYMKNTQFGHAINVIYTERGKEYFEPQTGKFIELTQEEKNTIYFETLIN